MVLDHFSNDAFRNFLCYIGVQLTRFCREKEEGTSAETLLERLGLTGPPTAQEELKMPFFCTSLLNKRFLPSASAVLDLWKTTYTHEEPSFESIEHHFFEIIRKKVQLTRFPMKTLQILHSLLFHAETLDTMTHKVPQRRDFLVFKLRSLYDEIVHFKSALLDAILANILGWTDDEIHPESDEAVHTSTKGIPEVNLAETVPLSASDSFDEAVPLPTADAQSQTNVEDFIDIADESSLCFEYRVLLAWRRAVLNQA
mmetsp:Transcript_33734/g.52758  ORF Transcript_33734/g.52758 Transcript_33734/m.52758 type:complete len:256 (-) Transcript_33734:28-795(-)